MFFFYVIFQQLQFYKGGNMIVSVQDLRDKAIAVKRLREKIKELTEYKEKCENALVEELKVVAEPEQKTFILGDISVMIADCKGYSLTEAGQAIMNTIPYSEKLWKKEIDMKEVRKDPRFKNYIIETPHRTRVTLKEVVPDNG